MHDKSLKEMQFEIERAEIKNKVEACFQTIAICLDAQLREVGWTDECLTGPRTLSMEGVTLIQHASFQLLDRVERIEVQTSADANWRPVVVVTTESLQMMTFEFEPGAPLDTQLILDRIVKAVRHE